MTEQKEVMIVGSSLRGFLLEPAYQAVRDMLLDKIKITKFLLTHPCVADFRAGQENRPRGAIPAEIIRSLEFLKVHGVRPEAVKLYTGTPTCFAVKTNTRMLINPYPYAKQAMDSPCFELEARQPIYEVFSTAHFGAFNMEFAEGFDDFDSMIEKLRNQTPEYSTKVECVLNHISPDRCRLRAPREP